MALTSLRTGARGFTAATRTRFARSVSSRSRLINTRAQHTRALHSRTPITHGLTHARTHARTLRLTPSLLATTHARLYASGTDVIEVNDDNFEEVILNDRGTPILVDCKAEWCGPCRQLGPNLEAAVAESNGAVRLAVLDVDESPECSEQLDITGVPAVFAFAHGKPVSKFVGNIPRDQIDGFIEHVVKVAQEGPAETVVGDVELPTGVEKEITREGTGDRPHNGSVVSVHYTGMFTDGKQFDSSVGGNPLQFTLGAGQVIKGWDLGIGSMRIGETARLTLSPEYAYGAQGIGPIPPNATLVFDVELIASE